MSLPKLVRPEYNTTLPSSGKKIRYQPFTVKEEKILILAAEGKDPEEITNAVRNTLDNCISHPSDVDVESLALFDIEYLFLKARSKSAGESIKLQVQDPNDLDFVTEHEINIDKIGVKKTKGHTDLIDIDETTKVKMKYPDLSFFNDGVDVSNVASASKSIARCVSQILIDDEVYNRNEMSDEEVEEWVEGLTSKDFQKLIQFFVTMPKLSHSMTIKNTNSGKNFTIQLEGLADFF